jgi:hypothetical protein
MPAVVRRVVAAVKRFHVIAPGTIAVALRNDDVSIWLSDGKFEDLKKPAQQ